MKQVQKLPKKDKNPTLESLQIDIDRVENIAFQTLTLMGSRADNNMMKFHSVMEKDLINEKIQNIKLSNELEKRKNMLHEANTTLHQYETVTFKKITALENAEKKKRIKRLFYFKILVAIIFLSTIIIVSNSLVK